MKLLACLCIALCADAQSLPDGPGKEVVERMCKPCHGLEAVARVRMSKDRWGDIVDDMVSRGAVGTDDEIEQVIDYLSANFSGPAPKVNVNKAGAAELMAALGLARWDAEAIARYRAAKGNFKDLQSVAKVPGIDAKKILASKAQIEF